MSTGAFGGGASDLAALCTAAALGDARAVERLLWLHHARLLGYARRKVGVEWRGRIDPEDVLQEAYVDIYARIGGLVCTDEDSFFRWASRIVAHKHVDHVRRLRSRKRDATRELAAVASGPGLAALIDRCLRDARTPSRAAQADDAARALSACIAQLPDDYRVAVQRLYLRHDPPGAVAADLGRSEEALRKLAARALARLRACLGRASRFMSTLS